MLDPIFTVFMHFPIKTLINLITIGAIAYYEFRQLGRLHKYGLVSRCWAVLKWMLVNYIVLLFFFTVFGRRSLEYYRYNFNAGYSYHEVYLTGNFDYVVQIAANIAVFIPVGFLGSLVPNRKGFLKGLLLGISLSLSIEMLQWVLRCGNTEIDDLINNSLGSFFGCVIAGLCCLAGINKLIAGKTLTERGNGIVKRVYITALTNERYIPGAMALVKSLREVNSKYDIAIMIPSEKEDSLGAALREYGVLDIAGTFLLPKESICLDELSYVVDEKYSYWRDAFFKLQAAGCVEFDKIILLDCDQMVVRNVDHLFDAPMFTATTCGRCVHPDWLSLSAGLLVLEPSQELHEKLISLILPAIESKKEKGLQAGDQDVFNLACPEWRNRPDLFIPEKYNICWGWISDLCKKEKITPKDFYMIHFPGKEKPWDLGKNHYLKLFASMLLHGKLDNLIYKTYIWKKYRDLCEHK